jgi:hypothetical protein
MDQHDFTLREVEVTRYITPLREGGSMPAIVSCSDDFLYVLKFKGAGQGRKALVAEVICAAITRLAGLRIPELVVADLDEDFARAEADEEIQDLIKFSVGNNLGMHYLKGAITFERNVTSVSAEEASKVVWLDAYLMNVDRTVRNTNMLIWQKELWIIDNGAALYFHHSWDNWEEMALKPFIQIKDHVLLPEADNVAAVNSKMKSILKETVFQSIVDSIPDEWLIDTDMNLSANDSRKVYVQFLMNRLNHSDNFINQVAHARENLI